MPDFATWSQANLAKFAKDCNEDRSRLCKQILVIGKSNDDMRGAMSDLLVDYEKLCDMFCKRPELSEAYLSAKRAINEP